MTRRDAFLVLEVRWEAAHSTLSEAVSRLVKLRHSEEKDSADIRRAELDVDDQEQYVDALAVALDQLR